MKNQVILQGSLLSHLDRKIYSVEEIVQLAIKCRKKGACMVHLHAYKVGGVQPFLEMARALELLNGPMLNISVSDYQNLISRGQELPRNIVSAAMHGGDCTVFGTIIQNSYAQVEADAERYLNAGIFPEVSIFNRRGVENCIRLNQKYHKQFFVGVYLGYPGEAEATKRNILEISERLKDCLFYQFILYNNQDDELYRYILECGGHLRSGMEDNLYCGARLAKDCVDHMEHLSGIIRAYGMEPAPADGSFWKSHTIRS